MKRIGTILLIAVNLLAQTGQNVVISQGPPIVPYQKLFFYSGGNVQYVCTALSTGPQPGPGVSVSAATRANPGVFTSAGHGFSTLSRPSIRFTAAPAGAWQALLTTWIATPIDANTFSVSSTAGTALDTSGYGTAFSGTATFVTQSPRTNLPVWAIQWLQYDGSNNVIAVMNAYATAGGGLTGVKCDDRAGGNLEWK